MSSRSLNKAMIIGNLTRDPELRYTPQGTAVCTFGVATNRSWVPSDGGERQEDVEFHRVVAWAKLAEICSQILYKGRRVYVDGRLQTRTWSGQDGQERSTTEVVADSMIALGQPRSGATGGRDVISEDTSEMGVKEEPAVDASPTTTVTVASDDDILAEEDEKKAEDKEKAKSKATKKGSKAAKKQEADPASEVKQEEVSEDDIPF